MPFNMWTPKIWIYLGKAKHELGLSVIKVLVNKLRVQYCVGSAQKKRKLQRVLSFADRHLPV